MNKKVIKTAIIIAWCLLIACFVFKLCGSKVFDIAVENNRFADICNWLDGDGIWLRYILMIALSYVSTMLIITASSLKTRLPLKWLIIATICYALEWTAKSFNATAGFILDIVICVVLPAVITKKWWTGFLGTVLTMAFQAISLLIRGANLSNTVEQNTILSLVISIDYYIMIVLYYMYVVLINKKKEAKSNGKMGSVLAVEEHSTT